MKGQCPENCLASVLGFFRVSTNLTEWKHPKINYDAPQITGGTTSSFSLQSLMLRKWPDLATEHIPQPKPVQPGTPAAAPLRRAPRPPLRSELPVPSSGASAGKPEGRPQTPLRPGLQRPGSPSAPSPTPRSGERRSQAASRPQEVPRHCGSREGAGPKGEGSTRARTQRQGNPAEGDRPRRPPHSTPARSPAARSPLLHPGPRVPRPPGPGAGGGQMTLERVSAESHDSPGHTHFLPHAQPTPPPPAEAPRSPPRAAERGGAGEGRGRWQLPPRWGTR